MKILAVDTATESCGVALSEGEQLIGEITNRRKQTHSRHVLGMIDALLRMCGMGAGDVDAYAVSAGPGSFTGLRIGISTVKGMVLASGKDMVGVSVPDVLAAQVFPGACPVCVLPVCVLTDARKGEVYTARYRYESGMLKKIGGEQVLAPEEALSGIAGDCLFVGRGAELYRSRIEEKLGKHARFAPPECNIIRASVLARLAWQRLRKGERDNAAAFGPRYIRKSDAELGFGKK